VDVVEMFPDEATHLIVVGDCLKSTVVCLVSSRGPLDAAVIHEGPGDVGYFGLEDEGDVFMKDGTGVRPSLW